MGLPNSFVYPGYIETRNCTHIHCRFTMPRLSQEVRERAIGMLEAGMRARAVARRLNVHASTIIRLRIRYREMNSTHDRRRSGRTHVTTPAQDIHIRLRHLRNRQLSAASIARETAGTYNRISSILCAVVYGRQAFVVVGRTLVLC